MRIHEILIDLGEAGVLAATAASGAYGAIPAQSHGRFRWLRAGSTHDRLEACTRAVGVEVQQDAMAALRTSLAHAVDSVKRRLDWAQARIGPDFREMPAQAFPLGDGRVLLLFSSMAPHALRVVDIPGGIL